MSRLAIAVGVLAVAAASASAATIRVDASGLGDYLTIQEGIDASSDGDTVLLASGVYTGPTNRGLDFDGRQISLIGEGGSQVTIIDCQGVDRAFVFETGESPDTVVEGLTVRNGSTEEGGAVAMSGASPTFRNCAFENNSAGFGGVFYLSNQASPHIEYCTFDNNSADDYGGAIYTFAALPYIFECNFTGNNAGISGGAISCKTHTVADIYNCRFTGNSAHDGGCIYVGTSFTEGDADLAPTYIGFNWFADNTAVRGGALFLHSFSWVTAQWSTFVRNTATQGGAVFCQTDAQGSLYLQSCTMLFNQAENGGGICSSGSSSFNELIVERCLIAFSTQGNSLHRIDYSPVTTDLSLAFGNEGGDVLYGSRSLFEDPLLCDMASEDFDLCENSPCRSANNPWGFLIGSYRQICGECTSSPVTETSWGSIKAMYR